MLEKTMTAIAIGAMALSGCNSSTGASPNSASDPAPGQASCTLVPSGWGPTGTVPLHVDKVVTGLEIPWAIGFLPGGDWLVTERPGRIRLVQGGKLVATPVAQIATGETGEGGVLGLALHPSFASNRYFYIFYTSPLNVNRVQRYLLSADHLSATPDQVIIDNIPSGTFHDGGRIKFGTDKMLYIATGDATTPTNGQLMSSLNGKILRVTPEGAVPADNPFPGSPIFASGIRNLEAFDWVSSKTLIVADNGPTGELGLTGLDEVSFASAGNNLGWPAITGCQTNPAMVTPILSWVIAAPPGGGLVYRGNAIPEFNGNFLIGMLGIGDGSAMQLHRVVFNPTTQSLISHEVYLQGQFGRLRDVEQGPDGALYVTTSNCDSRGTCPTDMDYILRITHG